MLVPGGVSAFSMASLVGQGVVLAYADIHRTMGVRGPVVH